MSTEIFGELESFRRFLEEQIESGNANLSPEESLQLWRAQRRERDGSVSAVKEALAEMEAGVAGKPLQQFTNEFRLRNKITRDA